MATSFETFKHEARAAQEVVLAALAKEYGAKDPGAIAIQVMSEVWGKPMTRTSANYVVGRVWWLSQDSPERLTKVSA